MAYRTLKPCDVTRIIALYKAGINNKEISRQTAINLRSVQRVICRFKEDGERLEPKPKPKSGRPRKFTERTLNSIKRQDNIQPSITAREIKDRNPRLLGNVSLRTVQLRLHDDLGFRSFKARKKPLINERQRTNRLNFCRKYSTWGEDDWKKVLWTDEATFFVTGSTAKRVYRHSGSDPNLPQYTCATVKHPTSVMVWGSFAYGGVGRLEFLPRNVMMNQFNYFELLNDVLEDSFNMSGAEFFMQDGAPCHTAKSVKGWLNDAAVPYFNDWPGQSPDINPIENLWAIIKQRLRSKDTSSLPNLKKSIQEVWDNIPKEMLENLSLSLPRRLSQCISYKGYAIKY